jgi:DNA modification methylase
MPAGISKFWPVELQNLSDLDLSFPVEITGFETAEIDVLVDGANGTSPTSSLDQIPPVADKTISRPGDLWLLGKHKLLCADAREVSSFETLMEGDRARVAFCDPPYNVPVDGHVCGLGLIKHRDFAMASGEMNRDEFIRFLTTAFKNTARFSVDGAIHFVCMDWRHIDELMTASKSVYSEFKNLCVWNKDNGGMGSFYRSKHELVFVFKVGTGPHVNTIELGRSGRYRTNVWDYAGINTLRAGRLADLALHPTVKPTALIIDAIKDCSRRGEIVLDPFGGAGTTLIAAEKSRRCARVMEVDAAYIDVSVRRWQDLFGQCAIHHASQQPFDEVAVGRTDAYNAEK